jgi:16S rRNA (guanine1207-N2)-methyltransferase
MTRRKPAAEAPAFAELAAFLGGKLRPPVLIVLGAPREAAELAAALPTGDVHCYQMDLYQAERLQEELAARKTMTRVATEADLWDLPATFETVLYPVPQGGERALKLDMLEQAFHLLAPGGTLAVLSPYERDTFFPGALKKIYGKVHTPAAGGGALLWCQRHGERPRRRHEMTFQARFDEKTSLRFVSRPGTFSYGRFDDGARALVETLIVAPGERVLDLGCGCGTNGIWAAHRSGLTGQITFVDSNARAIALARENAQANGLTSFQAILSSRIGLPEGSFDLALANPPYYAQLQIAQLFIERARVLLRPGGRFALVTKQPDQVGPIMAEVFGTTTVESRRGYVVLRTQTPGPAS